MEFTNWGENKVVHAAVEIRHSPQCSAGLAKVCSRNNLLNKGPKQSLAVTLSGFPHLKPHSKLNQYSYANTPWKCLFYWNHDFVNKRGSKPSFINIFPFSGASCLSGWGTSGKKTLNISELFLSLPILIFGIFNTESASNINFMLHYNIRRNCRNILEVQSFASVIKNQPVLALIPAG